MVEPRTRRMPMQRADEDRAELRRQLTETMALMLVIVSGVASWMTLPAPYFLSTLSIIVYAVFALSVVAYFLRARAPAAAQAIIVLAPTLALAWAFTTIESPALPYLPCLIVTANSAIAPGLGLAAAALNSASLVVLLPPADPLLPPLLLLWLITGTQLISSRGLYTVLRWTWNSQERASKLVQELRERQGELNRTLAALTEASRRLEHTNRELAIARREADEARALKEQFVANVSHELRTPLNLIMGFAEMMFLSPESYRGVVWTPELESDVGEIYRASRHLQGLVNDVLDLSRIDAARLPMFRELADIRAIIDDAVEAVAPLLRQHGLQHTVEYEEPLPQLFVDRTRIRQVMLNLLNNAVRFTDAGGVAVRARLAEDSVVVSVRDTGIGIPSEQLEAVFDKFRQVGGGPRGRGGAGLGLALSRQFVALHGGQMWVESQEGVGSTFFFSLPVPGTRPPTASLQRSPERWRADWSAAPLIVVDPDPAVAQMLSRHLDRHVVPATDARQAEALVEETHPQAIIVNQRPDLPAETWVGGFGLASERYAVPVLRCSVPSTKWSPGAAGFDDYLGKPVTRESLQQLVQRYCPTSDTILVVDDSPGFLGLMERMLRTMSPARDVLTADCGVEGLRIARERVPRLVLLDLLMPGMDGFALLRALRAEPGLHGTAIVALTASSYLEEALLCQSRYFTLTQASGLSTGSLMELIRGALSVVRPDYLREESTAHNV
mgnify:CR=1 FL=1